MFFLCLLICIQMHVYFRNIYKNPKEIRKSSSNGSSFMSNSSISSGLSAFNTTNDSNTSPSATNANGFTTMMMMMPLAKNKSPSTSKLDEIIAANNAATASLTSPPPPKPNRNGNLNKLVDLSPSKISSTIHKRNYPLNLKINSPTGLASADHHIEKSNSSSNLKNLTSNVIILNRKDIDKQQQQLYALQQTSDGKNFPHDFSSLNNYSNKIEKRNSYTSTMSTLSLNSQLVSILLTK